MKRFKKLTTLGLVILVGVCAALVVSGCASSESYTPPKKDPVVSGDALGKQGVLRVGVSADKAPLSAKTSAGEFRGVDIDIAAALADELGLKLELVEVGADPAADLNNGTVDIVMGVDSSESLNNAWVSEVYLPTAVVLFSKDKNAQLPVSGSPHLKIAAQLSKKSAWCVTNEFEQNEFVGVSQPKEAFEKLDKGEVQYVASDAIVGAYTAFRNLSEPVYIVGLMQQPSGCVVAVKDTNTELKTALSNALTTIKGNGMIDVVERSWFGMVLDFENANYTAGAKQDKSTKTSTDVSKTSGADTAQTVSNITSNGNTASRGAAQTDDNKEADDKNTSSSAGTGTTSTSTGSNAGSSTGSAA